MSSTAFDPSFSPPNTPNPSRKTGRGHDWLLRLDPPIAAAYEAAIGQQRKRELGWSILIGLLLYNGFFLTSILLMPDVVTVNFVARFVIVTPASLALIWLIRKVSLETAEWLVTAGMVNAFFAMIWMVWTSDAPLASYAIAELTLVLVFGAFSLNMRFLQCMIFLLVSSAGSFALIQSMPDLGPDLRAALRMQALAGLLFCAYGNLQIELGRVRGFVRAWRAGEEASDMTALSLTDPLTGLRNRRALEGTIQGWVRSAEPVTLIMIDIDHFKLYNDTLGHPAGDACLRRVATALTGALDPGSDFLARIGGEEFAVALQGPATQEAERISERLRARVAAASLAHPGRTDGMRIVTISVGAARPRPGVQTSLSDLFSCADAALYEAKRAGRNRVRIEVATRIPPPAA